RGETVHGAWRPAAAPSGLHAERPPVSGARARRVCRRGGDLAARALAPPRVLSERHLAAGGAAVPGGLTRFRMQVGVCRCESRSVLSWADMNGWGRGTFLWSIGAGVAAMVVSLLATRNTAAGFATSIAFSLMMTFAFGSKAFCNYYYFVIGALCCAVAASVAE